MKYLICCIEAGQTRPQVMGYCIHDVIGPWTLNGVLVTSLAASVIASHCSQRRVNISNAWVDAEDKQFHMNYDALASPNRINKSQTIIIYSIRIHSYSSIEKSTSYLESHEPHREETIIRRQAKWNILNQSFDDESACLHCTAQFECTRIQWRF